MGRHQRVSNTSFVSKKNSHEGLLRTPGKPKNKKRSRKNRNKKIKLTARRHSSIDIQQMKRKGWDPIISCNKTRNLGKTIVISDDDDEDDDFSSAAHSTMINNEVISIPDEDVNSNTLNSDFIVVDDDDWSCNRSNLDVTVIEARRKPELSIILEDGEVIDTTSELNKSTASVYSTTQEFISENIYTEQKFKHVGLRPIVIDASNIAMGHSNGKFFSVKGLKICIDYFKKRKHKVFAFVPAYRLKHNQSDNPPLLRKLVNDQLVFCTSSREVLGKKICSYDDRILVQVAAAMGAIIVSGDNYRDLVAEDRRLAPIIEKRLLMPMWVGDMIVFPQDPLGRHGPNLEAFLSF